MRRNHILSCMSTADCELIKKHLEPVEMPRLFTVETAGKPITHVYFPVDGIVSVVANGPRDQRIEVGIVGRDGVSGQPVILSNDRSPNSVFMQIAGSGFRIESDRLRAAMLESRSLHQALLVYAQAFAAQASHTALANGRATLDARLARWLLMAQDRLEGDRVALTHELLSIMLGVQRPGVTLALQKMEVDGNIETQRSVIVIKDRQGLKRAAKGFYGVPEAEQERLTGWRSLHHHPN
jgi:CRP-like cAMP-binding protein